VGEGTSFLYVPFVPYGHRYASSVLVDRTWPAPSVAACYHSAPPHTPFSIALHIRAVKSYSPRLPLDSTLPRIPFITHHVQRLLSAC
jgi:hypothetical protein